MSAGNRKITLLPVSRLRWPWYLLGILLTPLFGYGIYLLIRKHRHFSALEYLISDTGIEIRDENGTRFVALETINGGNAVYPWWLKSAEVGHITLLHDLGSDTLYGLEHPDQILEMILVSAANLRNAAKPAPSVSIPLHDAGALDPLNDLVGLWQQGMITDDEYEAERRKWERR